MKKHKQYISEWKSVNDNVKDLSRYIVNAIWEDSMSKGMSLSNMTFNEFIDGKLDVNINDAIGENSFNFDVLTVQYIIYFFASHEEYEAKKHLIGNSEADYDNQTITIKTVSINGGFIYNAYEDVYHEVEHMFSYSNGMEKRKELYDKVMAYINDKDKRKEYLKSIAYLLYFTFPHEQDAFANQFYGFLTANNPTEGFDELIMTKTNYGSFRQMENMYTLCYASNRKACNDVLNYFGYNAVSFKKRIHFGKSRLKKKLRNVYIRYELERRASSGTVDENLRHMRYCNEILNEYRKRYKSIEYKREEFL